MGSLAVPLLAVMIDMFKASSYHGNSQGLGFRDRKYMVGVFMNLLKGPKEL